MIWLLVSCWEESAKVELTFNLLSGIPLYNILSPLPSNEVGFSQGIIWELWMILRSFFPYALKRITVLGGVSREVHTFYVYSPTQHINTHDSGSFSDLQIRKWKKVKATWVLDGILYNAKSPEVEESITTHLLSFHMCQKQKVQTSRRKLSDPILLLTSL